MTDETTEPVPETRTTVVREPSTKMTYTEFARAMGVTEGAVRKAIKAGRISTDSLGRTKSGARPCIANASLAANEWANNVGPMARRQHKEIDYDTLPPDIRRARIARDLSLARQSESRVKQNRRGESMRRDHISIEEVIAAVHLAGLSEIEKASSSDRRLVRALVARIAKQVKKELEDESDTK